MPPSDVQTPASGQPAQVGADRFAVVRQPIAHDSAVKHVTGAAQYIDDMLEPIGTLHIAPGYAPIAAGKVTSIDLEAVKTSPGVVTVVPAHDSPGQNENRAKGRNDRPA